MRSLKFRQFVNGRFHYWGFLEKDRFTGPVNPSDSSQQFTGLFSGLGKEIYEGDIVESVSPMVELGSGKPTGGIGIVRRTIEYRMEKGAFWARRLPDGRWETFGLTQERLTEYYTVVGNVHENPELLK